MRRVTLEELLVITGLLDDAEKHVKDSDIDQIAKKSGEIVDLFKNETTIVTFLSLVYALLGYKDVLIEAMQNYIAQKAKGPVQ